MRTVKIPAERACAGDIVAEDIMNQYGAVVVAANTILNEYMTNKLVEYSIGQVAIYSRYDRNAEREKAEYRLFLKTYENNIYVMKKMITGLYNGKGMDIDSVNLISKDILNGFDSSPNLLCFLDQLKHLDEYTYIHSINVGIYSMLIAKWMALPRHEVEDILRAGILHDIGKIRIPPDILNKNTALTPGELEEIKRHSVYGYRILESAAGLTDAVKNAVLMHHERMDGSGYPSGLEGEHIHLYARIVAVADVYDAMTSDRVYRKKVTPFDVFDMFQTIGIRGFDTGVLWTFLRNIPVYYIGSRIVLSNGCTGEIVYIPPHCITRPVIASKHGLIDLSKDDSLKIISVFAV